MRFQSRVSALLAAVLASTFGDGLIPVAFAIQSFRLDSSGRLLTAVLIALWSAKLLSSLLMERVPASRFPARAMILSDTGRALAQGGLLLWMFFTPEYWPIAFVVSSFCYGLCTPWFGPHRFSLLSVILAKEERHKANSILAMIGDALFLAGPLVGTALTVGLGFQAVLLIDVLTFLISIALVASYWNVRAAEQEVSAVAQQEAENQVLPRGITLPTWVSFGLFTWLMVSVAIGFIGTAAPTVVMQHFSEFGWGWVAAFGASGSLLGSFSSNWAPLKKIPWNLMQFGACIAYILHLFTLTQSPNLALIAIVTALSGGLVAIPRSLRMRCDQS